MFATLRYACLLLFWFFQSPRAETPAWILTLNTSNDAVLRKDDPFDSYTSEFSYLTDFLEKSKKLPLFQWGNYENAITPVVYKIES